MPHGVDLGIQASTVLFQAALRCSSSSSSHARVFKIPLFWASEGAQSFNPRALGALFHHGHMEVSSAASYVELESLEVQCNRSCCVYLYININIDLDTNTSTNMSIYINVHTTVSMNRNEKEKT